MKISDSDRYLKSPNDQFSLCDSLGCGMWVLLRDGIRTVRFDTSERYNRPMDAVTEFLNLF